jgi:hypothetical protein
MQNMSLQRLAFPSFFTTLSQTTHIYLYCVHLSLPFSLLVAWMYSGFSCIHVDSDNIKSLQMSESVRALCSFPSPIHSLMWGNKVTLCSFVCFKITEWVGTKGRDRKVPVTYPRCVPSRVSFGSCSWFVFFPQFLLKLREYIYEHLHIFALCFHIHHSASVGVCLEYPINSVCSMFCHFQETHRALLFYWCHACWNFSGKPSKLLCKYVVVYMFSREQFNFITQL